MIRQIINVDNYWRVIVYYNIDYDLFYYISKDLEAITTPVEEIIAIKQTLQSRKAKAVTCSNIKYKTSVVGFNYHCSYYDYINSIVHEAEHIKQAMLKAYDVLDKGEPPAYTIGYIVMKMLKVFHSFLKL